MLFAAPDQQPSRLPSCTSCLALFFCFWQSRALCALHALIGDGQTRRNLRSALRFVSYCHVSKKHASTHLASIILPFYVPLVLVSATMKVQLLSAACALLALAPQCSAFGVAMPSSVMRSTTSLNIFGNLKGAFSNDDSLGKVDATPGLKGVSRVESNG